jgi:prefoldin subunit 5
MPEKKTEKEFKEAVNELIKRLEELKQSLLPGEEELPQPERNLLNTYRSLTKEQQKEVESYLEFLKQRGK